MDTTLLTELKSEINNLWALLYRTSDDGYMQRNLTDRVEEVMDFKTWNDVALADVLLACREVEDFYGWEVEKQVNEIRDIVDVLNKQLEAVKREAA